MEQDMTTIYYVENGMMKFKRMPTSEADAFEEELARRESDN